MTDQERIGRLERLVVLLLRLAHKHGWDDEVISFDPDITKETPLRSVEDEAHDLAESLEDIWETGFGGY